MTQGREPARYNDAPIDRADAERHFATEDACRGYLVGLRWPDGFVCPDRACDGRRAWRSARGLYRCAACGRQTSPTAGTALADTRHTAHEWFEMLWLFAGKDGVSAETLRVALGLGSYESAWAWLHKVRRAIAEREPARLVGTIELAAIPLWNVEGGGRRGSGRPPMAALAVEARDTDTGQIRLARLPPSRAVALERFLADAVTPGSMLRTNLKLGAWVAELGLTLEPEAGRAKRELNLWQLDTVDDKLEKWCAATHHGAISRRQLDFYLAEFEFRFNHRREPQALRFRRLLEVIVAAAPKTRVSLIGGIEAAAVRDDRHPPARIGRR